MAQVLAPRRPACSPTASRCGERRARLGGWRHDGHRVTRRRTHVEICERPRAPVRLRGHVTVAAALVFVGAGRDARGDDARGVQPGARRRGRGQASGSRGPRGRGGGSCWYRSFSSSWTFRSGSRSQLARDPRRSGPSRDSPASSYGQIPWRPRSPFVAGAGARRPARRLRVSRRLPPPGSASRCSRSSR